MSRILLSYVLPLILPLLLYCIWLAVHRWRRQASGAAVPEAWGLRDAPWTWLFIGGIALLGASLVSLALLGSSPPESKYVPSSIVDGEIVPSHTE